MRRLWLPLLALLLFGLPALAMTPPEIRLLQSEEPADWEEAVRIILPTDRSSVPPLSIAALTPRLPGLRPETQLRVMRKMNYALERDPRVVAVYRRLVAAGSPEVQEAARRALDQLAAEVHVPAPPADRAAPPWRRPVLLAVALVVVLVPLALGVTLFFWGFRLARLLGLLRRLPVSRVRTLTPGLTALRGEVHPAGEPLFHPQTDELCVYYAGAEKQNAGLRFWLADEGGRVAVDPAGVVMLSADGLLLPGEAVRLIGSVERVGEGLGSERWVVRKPRLPRSAFERLVHLVVGRLFGFFAAGGLSKMLFSDPRRCFWIWDEDTGQPFGSRREVALVVAVFLFAGVWVATAALAATALLDRDLSFLLAWLG